MTQSSTTRRKRRLDKKTAGIVKAEAPKSIITLTEAPGGGFTLALGLHGARMDELFPDESHPLSIVDVIALAVANIIRLQPQDFQNAVKLVNDTLLSVNQQIEDGADVDEAIAGADAALEGAVSDVKV